MAQKLNITIPQPCHENWGNMTPAEQGRHCQSCNKIVVDFTTMTDAQVVAYFKTKQTTTCGRFRNDQLDRKINMNPDENSTHRFKYLAVSLLATGAFIQNINALDLHDTIFRHLTQTDTTRTDSTSALSIKDSFDLEPPDIAVMVGDIVTEVKTASVFETIVYALAGEPQVTMGKCVTPAKSEELLKPFEKQATTHHTSNLPLADKPLKRHSDLQSPAPIGEVPPTRNFHFRLDKMFRRLRVVFGGHTKQKFLLL